MGNCHKQMLVSNEITGDINADCGEDLTLWATDLRSAFGSVTVTHAANSGCGTMKVFINKKRVFSLERGQTEAVTVDDLRKLSIECTGTNSGVYRGEFTIDLHYLQPASENEKHRRRENDEDVAPVSMNRICRY